MSFILELSCNLPAVQGRSRTNYKSKSGNFGKNLATAVKIHSYCGAWDSEHNGTTFVTKPHILKEIDEHFVHQGII